MTTRKRLPRYEIKIPCDPQLLPQIQSWVQLHPAHWQAAYPPRQVNNIYFDTADCQSLNENLGGHGIRAKLRLRWYGANLETIVGGQLELKYKEGMVGWKEIWVLDETLSLSRSSWSEFYPALRQAAGPQAGLWLDKLTQPVLINHYQRSYYVAPDQAVRLTLDTALRAYNQRFSNRPNLHRPAPTIQRTIIELKASVDPIAHQRLGEALAHFPLRPDRYSKYVQGMLAGPDFDGVELW